MTYVAAHNALRARFNTEWGATTTVAWDNSEFVPPAGTASWVRFNIIDGVAAQVSMGSTQNFYRHPGIIVVNIFVPLNQGDSVALSLADSAGAIFRSWQDASSGIRCFAPSVDRVGEHDKWYQLNVTIPFDRDSLF